MSLSNFTVKKKHKNTVRVQVRQNNGLIRNQAPVTLKGFQKGIKGLDDIGNVEVVDLVDGATLVYNEATETYQIRRLRPSDIEGDFDLDGGTF